MSGTPAIAMVGLSKRFGATRAVDQLSLEVPEGALFGLIGKNGAGKTTTMSLLLGFLRPDAGEIRIRGQLFGPGRPRAGVLVALPQDAELPPKEKVGRALSMLAELGGLDPKSARRKVEQALASVSMLEAIDKRIGTLSHGQRRRVGVAQTLFGEQEIILLDEPTAGLDPLAAAELRALVKSLHKERTIVISSHNLAELEAMCSHAAIIDQGRLVSSDTMSQLKGQSRAMRVGLASAPAEVERLLDGLRRIPGVRAARWALDEKAIAIEFADEGDAAADALANEVLKQLIGGGAAIGKVERGQSLEQRFLEDTRSAARLRGEPG